MKLLLLFLLSLSVFSQEIYRIDSMDKKELAMLKELSGNYVNSRGDSLKVIFNTVTENGQLDLFGPQEFEFYGDLDLESSYDNYNFDLDTFEKNSDEQYSFSSIEDDCDNPGCSNYEVSFLFKKNRKGSFFVTIDISVFVNDEEIIYLLEDEGELEYEEMEAILEKGCKESYGKEAYLSDYDYDGGSGYVYCAYEKKIYLKKE